MRRVKHLLFLIGIMYAVSMAGQSRADLREMFVSAEGDLLFEDYAEALPKYLSLLQIYPENYNLYFRIGQCYLHTPGQKDKAIPFLETASQNIDPEYRRGKLRETGAPYDVLYFLANAYRISNDFDRAVKTYELFLREGDTEVYDTSLVRFQIETCHNARKMMRNPAYIVEKNLGNTVNSRFSEINPVISSDEKTLLFTRELPFYDAIFWSVKVDGNWSEPVNLTPQLGIDQDYYTSSVSHDGKTLLLYRTDTYDGNIYESTLSGDTWSNVRKLNGNINTKYWESHAVMTRDGRKIFFTSNRRESLGGLDIFMAERDSTGDWGTAVNLGAVINTPYNEETPFLANNDRTLFFSSRGHYNMGGYDIFRSDLDENGNWGKPVNVGYPVNTTDDDLFFSPAGKGNRGYLSRFTGEGEGLGDIISCHIYSELNPRNFIIMGRAGVRNLLEEFPPPVKVTAVNSSDLQRMVTTLTNPATGAWSFRLPNGSYRFTYESDDALPVTMEHEMPLGHPGDTIRLDPVILEETDFVAQLLLLGDTIIDTRGKEPVEISLISGEQALLKIEVLSPDSVITTDHQRMADSAFTYSFVPEEGRSDVTFRLTDRFGNQAGAAVTVNRSDAPARREVPLYHEIPVQHAIANTEEGPDDDIATRGVSTGDTLTYGDQDALPVSSDDAGRERKCRLWWLLPVAGLFILFLLLLRRKKKKNDDQ
jgi:hypothetical protein